MAFHSVLFQKTDVVNETPEPPAFFADLNLDQLIDAITAGKHDYNLKPLFYTSLHDVNTIHYRHEVLHDLEDDHLLEHVKAFAYKMRTMRAHLTQSDKLHYQCLKQNWFLDAVEIYCEAVQTLAQNLTNSTLKSRGLLAFRDYITRHAQSTAFTTLLRETQERQADLTSANYCLLIKGNSITVRKYESEIDYSPEVERIFEKFKQDSVRDYTIKFSAGPDINHVEARILDLVAQLYPATFSNLDDYYTANKDYLDKTLSAFDREIQFYIAYMEFIARLTPSGLNFCYPKISEKDKQIYVYEAFDIVLANKLIGERSPVVCNDFYLQGKERTFVVSGPNQGGKTTFARTFGQLHYLASIGCLVPGRQAQLFLFDNLFTHFEKEEDIQSLMSKLEDDLVRMHQILEQATPDSIIIMNEIFTSTTLQDAIFLGKEVMEKITELDALCVLVTFIDELASLNEQIVSVVSTIVAENPAQRTYKIIRKHADGLAYATSLAEKYQLDYASLKERIKS